MVAPYERAVVRDRRAPATGTLHGYILGHITLHFKHTMPTSGTPSTGTLHGYIRVAASLLQHNGGVPYLPIRRAQARSWIRTYVARRARCCACALRCCGGRGCEPTKAPCTETPSTGVAVVAAGHDAPNKVPRTKTPSTGVAVVAAGQDVLNKVPRTWTPLTGVAVIASRHDAPNTMRKWHFAYGNYAFALQTRS